VTLGNTGKPVTVSNVAAGVDNNDAVNIKQLADAGLVVNSTGVVQNAFVAYDSTAKTGVTLGNGTVGAQIHHLVAGTDDADAVNVEQLKTLGATIGTSGTVTNSFVSYSGTTEDLVSLLGTSGTKISNVAVAARSLSAATLVRRVLIPSLSATALRHRLTTRLRWALVRLLIVTTACRWVPKATSVR
jgi:hypothetical protein